MPSQISSVFTLALEPCNFPAFQALVSEIVTATQQEPGTLIYEYSVNAERTEAHIFERYRADAVVSHVDTTFAPFAERFSVW